MAKEFIHHRRVEFCETDMAGIVHFANFFRWMEAAEHAFLRALGHSVHGAGGGAGAGSSGWPRVKASCEYLHPLRFEEEIEVGVRVLEVRTRSVRYGFSIRPKGAEAEAAKGEFTAVHTRIDARTGTLQAVPIPEPLRSQLLERANEAP